MRAVRILAVVAALAGAAACSGKPASEPAVQTSASANSTVLFADDFETSPFRRWEPLTRSAWRWEKLDGSHVFSQVRNVDPHEPVRAPFNRNITKGVVVDSFRLDVDVQSTTHDYEHRDLCLIFGYRDPAHMYYVHFGKVTDKNSNGVFLVNGKDRVKISSPDVPGTPWDSKWHHARIVRDARSGSIDVYFDDVKRPVISVVDKTFTSGRIGIGSFDDTGRFDNVVVRKIVPNSVE